LAIIQIDEFGEINAKVKGVRLLSLDRRMQRTRSGEVDRFPEMLAHWKSAEGPFASLPPSTWAALAEKQFPSA
jgi:intracellular multiplication protein IcmJ